MSSHYLKPLIPDHFYHILNRGINGSAIFFRKENYDYFLKKYDSYLSDYLTTYSYCLLGNHFHLLVKLFPGDEIIQRALKNEDVPNSLSKFLKLGKTYETELAGLIVSNQFRKFFMSYAKAINIQEKRTGSLFEKNFERLKIENLNYLNTVIRYIHHNPIHHHFTDNFKDYPYSSYERIIVPKPSKLPKEQILENFNGIKNYIEFHKEKHTFGIPTIDFPSFENLESL